MFTLVQIRLRKETKKVMLINRYVNNYYAKGSRLCYM